MRCQNIRVVMVVCVCLLPPLARSGSMRHECLHAGFDVVIGLPAGLCRMVPTQMLLIDPCWSCSVVFYRLGNQQFFERQEHRPLLPQRASPQRSRYVAVTLHVCMWARMQASMHLMPWNCMCSSACIACHDMRAFMLATMP